MISWYMNLCNYINCFVLYINEVSLHLYGYQLYIQFNTIFQMILLSLYIEYINIFLNYIIHLESEF